MRSLAGQTVIYGMSSIVGRLLNFLLYPFFTWFIAKEAFGVVGELYGYVAFFNVLFALGMETTYFYYAGKYDEQKASNTAMQLIAAISIPVCLLLFFSADSVAQLLKLEHSGYVRLIALMMLFDALVVIPFARLRKENKAKKFAVLRLVGISLNIVANLFFLVWLPNYFEGGARPDMAASFNAYQPSFFIFLSNVLASGLLFILLFRGVSFNLDSEMIKRMLRYSWPLVVVGLAAMINETLDKPMLRLLLTEDLGAVAAREQVGIYSAVYKISMAMALVVQAFKFAAEPFFFNIQKEVNARETYALVLKWFVIVECIVFITICLNLKWVLIIIDPAYRVGAAVVPVVLMAQMFLGVYYNLSVWYKVTEQTHWGMIISVIGSLVTLVLLFVLIPEMGYMGAAWATLSCYLIMMLLSFALGRRFYKVPYQYARIVGYFIVIILMWQGMELIPENNGLLKELLGLLVPLMFIGLVWGVEKPQKLLFLRK